MGKIKNSRVAKSTIIDFIFTFIFFIILFSVCISMSINLNAMDLSLFFVVLILFTSFKNLIIVPIYLKDEQTNKLNKKSYFIYIFSVTFGLIVTLFILHFGLEKEYSVVYDNLEYQMLSYSSVNTVGFMSFMAAMIVFLLFHIVGKNIAISYFKREKDEFSTFYYFSAIFMLIEVLIIVLNYYVIFKILQDISIYSITTIDFIIIFTIILIYLSIIRMGIYLLTNKYYDNASNANEFEFGTDFEKRNFDTYIIAMIVLILSLQLFFINDLIIEEDNNVLVYNDAQAYYEQLNNELSKSKDDDINYIYISDLVYSIYETENNDEVIALINDSLESRGNFEDSDHMNLLASIKESLLFEEVNGTFKIREEGEFLGSPVLSVSDNDEEVTVFSTIGSISNPDAVTYSENEIITAVESTFKGNLVEDLNKKSSDSYDASIVINEKENTGYVRYYNLKDGD